MTTDTADTVDTVDTVDDADTADDTDDVDDVDDKCLFEVRDTRTTVFDMSELTVYNCVEGFN